ncbi:hypothetical protein IW262DRAFT_1405438 [Armillaria fumosa]|nr:hypothetical protein IW262DRAFT_1405438 [Armillaria fumosa]
MTFWLVGTSAALASVRGILPRRRETRNCFLSDSSLEARIWMERDTRAPAIAHENAGLCDCPIVLVVHGPSQKAMYVTRHASTLPRLRRVMEYNWSIACRFAHDKGYSLVNHKTHRYYIGHNLCRSK